MYARRKKTVPDPELRRRLRSARREELVAATLRELAGTATHERVAEVTGVPVGYLRWAYPTLADLRAGRARAEARR